MGSGAGLGAPSGPNLPSRTAFLMSVILTVSGVDIAKLYNNLNVRQAEG